MTPEIGDWVRLTRAVPVTMTDHLLGGDAGLRRGTRGVVTGRTGRSMTVEFDAGWGSQRATVPAHHTRVVRRAGGVTRFRSRTRIITLARLGVALMLAWPFLQYTVEYLWLRHTTDGLEEGLVVGFLDGLLNFLIGALDDPVRTVVYLVVLVVLSRFAFGRR